MSVAPFKHPAARLALLAVIGLLVACSGCGNDSGEQQSSGNHSAADLLAHLPDRGQFAGELVYADLRGLREQLDQGEGERAVALDQVQALALPWASSLGQGDTPVTEAIDDEAVGGVASTIVRGPGAVSTLSTTQSFESIAEALESRGYARDGEMLVAEGGKAAGDGVAAVVEGDDGSVILAGSPEAAFTARSRGGLSSAGRLIAESPGALRVGVTGDGEGGCVLASVAGQDFMPPRAELRLVLTDSADPESLIVETLRDPLLGALEVESVRGEDRQLIVILSYKPTFAANVLGPASLARLNPSTLYSC